MRFFQLPNALLLAVYTSSVAAAIHDGHRVLRAATKRSDLLKRDTRILQKFESEIVYIEGLHHCSQLFRKALMSSTRERAERCRDIRVISQGRVEEAHTES